MPGLRQALLRVTFGLQSQRVATLKPFKSERISVNYAYYRLLWPRAIPRLHSTVLFLSP